MTGDSFPKVMMVPKLGLENLGMATKGSQKLISITGGLDSPREISPVDISDHVSHDGSMAEIMREKQGSSSLAKVYLDLDLDLDLDLEGSSSLAKRYPSMQARGYMGAGSREQHGRSRAETLPQIERERVDASSHARSTPSRPIPSSGRLRNSTVSSGGSPSNVALGCLGSSPDKDVESWGSLADKEIAEAKTRNDMGSRSPTPRASGAVALSSEEALHALHVDHLSTASLSDSDFDEAF